MPMTTAERLEMLQVASKAWLKLKRLIDTIPDAALEHPNTIGTWSGRDMLGHLAGWVAIGIDIANQINERGEFTRLGLNGETVNAFNEEMLVPYRAMSTADVRSTLEDTHFALMQIAETSQANIIEVVLDVTDGHYRKHMDDLRGVPRA